MQLPHNLSIGWQHDMANVLKPVSSGNYFDILPVTVGANENADTTATLPAKDAADGTTPVASGNYFDGAPVASGNYFDGAPVASGGQFDASQSDTHPEDNRIPIKGEDNAKKKTSQSAHSAVQSAIDLATGARPVNDYVESALSAFPRVSFGGAMFEGTEAKKILDSIILPNDLATSANNLFHAPNTIIKDVLKGTYGAFKDAVGNIEKDPFLPLALVLTLGLGKRELLKTGGGEGIAASLRNDTGASFGKNKTAKTNVSHTGAEFEEALHNDATAHKEPVRATNSDNQLLVDGLIEEAATKGGGKKIDLLRAARQVSKWNKRYNLQNLSTISESKSASPRRYIQEAIDIDSKRRADLWLMNSTGRTNKKIIRKMQRLANPTKKSIESAILSSIPKDKIVTQPIIPKDEIVTKPIMDVIPQEPLAAGNNELTQDSIPGVLETQRELPVGIEPHLQEPDVSVADDPVEEVLSQEHLGRRIGEVEGAKTPTQALHEAEVFKDSSGPGVNWEEVAEMGSQMSAAVDVVSNSKKLKTVLENNSKEVYSVDIDDTSTASGRATVLAQIAASGKISSAAKRLGVSVRQLGTHLGVGREGIIEMESLVDAAPSMRMDLRNAIHDANSGLSKKQVEDASDALVGGLGVLTHSSHVAINSLVENMKATRRIVPDYSPGVLPTRQVPGIHATIPVPTRDVFATLRKPHNVFRRPFGTKESPVIDMEESLNAYIRNVSLMHQWAADVLKGVDSGEALISKELLPIYKTYSKSIFKQGNAAAKLHNVNAKISATQPSNFEALEKLELERAHILADLREAKKSLSGMTSRYDSKIADIAKNSSGVRIILHAGDMLPLSIELSPLELEKSGKIRYYFETTRAALKKSGIPVIEDKAYVPQSFGGMLQKNKSFGLNSSDKETPAMLKFLHQLPDSRIWNPSPHKLLDRYIGDVEKKLAYQPFLDKWQPITKSAEFPGLKKFITKWINRNVFPDSQTLLQKAGNIYVGVEYVRLVGASLRVAKKHLFKVAGTIARYDLGTNAKAIAEVQKVPLQYAADKLGIKGNKAELDLVKAFINARELTHSLDETPLLNTWSKLNTAFKFLSGGPVSLTELLDNGISIIASAIKGGQKGLSFADTQRGLWETILDVNQRSGPDQYLWQKKLGPRMATMFLSTPLKIAENQFEMISRALHGERDIFGTHYGSILIRYLILIGVAESIARARGTSIEDSVLETPGIDTEKLGPTLSPPLQLYKQWNQYGFSEGSKKHFNYFGSFTQYSNVKSSKYNHDRYKSAFNYVWGFADKDYEPRRAKKGKSGASLLKLKWGD